MILRFYIGIYCFFSKIKFYKNLNFVYMKKLQKFLFISNLSFIFLLTPNKVNAQAVQSLQAPSIGDLPTLNIGDSGTLKQTVTSGSKGSLTFGSSTSFGASSNLTSTLGVKTRSLSFVKLESTPEGSSEKNLISNTIGGGGTIRAEISNLRANNETPSNGINSTDSNYTNGTALLEGITSTNQLALDGEDTIFTSEVATIHNESDFAQITSANVETSSSIGNASSSAIINHQTVVDIDTNQFISSFQQAF